MALACEIYKISSSGIPVGGIFDLPVKEIGLYNRTVTALEREGIRSVGDLVSSSDRRVLTIPYLQYSDFSSIKEGLKELGLHFGMTREEIEEFQRKEKEE